MVVDKLELYEGRGKGRQIKPEYLMKNENGACVLTPFGRADLTDIIINQQRVTPAAVAEELGIVPNTFLKWIAECPELRDMMRDGRRAVVGALTESAITIALVQRDPKMTMFLLEKLSPDTFGKNVKIEGELKVASVEVLWEVPSK